MRGKFLRYIGLLAAMSLVAGPADAALVSTDLNTSGDGLLTLDTSTDLEWLDFTVTTQYSAEQILAGSGGWLAEGFRYATQAEYDSMLLGSAGFQSLNNMNSIHEAPAANFNALFNTANTACDGGATSCAFLVSDSGNGVNLLNVTANGANSQALILTDYESLDWNNMNYGSALLRSTVPIPAAVWLFGSTLCVLGWVRRRKAA